MAKKFTGASMQAINEALQAPQVRRALEAKARRVLNRTQAIALSEGATEMARELTIRSGTRPGTKAAGGLKRPYARVEAVMTEDQRKKDAAGSKATPTTILRRGASG